MADPTEAAEEEALSRMEEAVLYDPGERGVRHIACAGHLLRAADVLRGASSVVLITGFPVLPEGACETDGPYGTVALARTLLALGKRVCVLSDEPHESVLRACMTEAGVARDAPLEVWPVALREGPEAAARARQLLEERGADCAVAIERAGPSAGDGLQRNMRGLDVSAFCAPVHALFEEAAAAGVPTVAVGDGGNEVGMGHPDAAASVRRHVRHGERIACRTPADTLVVAGVSNWGAAALAVAAYVRAGRPAAAAAALPSAAFERRMWEAGHAAGAVDGVTGKRELSVDGFPFAVHEGVLGRLLAEI